LDHANNIPADAVTNTYHFNATSLLPLDLENILDLLGDLYAEQTTSDPLMSLMSDENCAGTGDIKLYDLGDPEPRAPIASRVISETPLSTGGLPSEVALCVSFQGVPLSGVSQARRRGRVFLPWFTENQNQDGRPAQTLIDDVGLAFSDFGAAAAASITNSWVIYSRANDDTVDVNNGWIDNAWDIQRRRGVDPTVRTTFGPD
jgi:hypothetical protein